MIGDHYMGSETIELIRQIPMELLLNSVDCGLCLLEVGDTIRYLYANDGYFVMLGYTREEFMQIVQNGAEQMFSPSSTKKSNQAIRHAVKSGETVELDYIVRLRNETKQYHHMKCVPIQKQGLENPKVIAIITDVTDKETLRISIEKQYRKSQRLYKREMRYLEGLSGAIIAALKADLTTEIVEFHRINSSNGFIYFEKEQYQECLNKISEGIEDEEEKEAFIRCFDREKLLTLFEQGEHEVELEYRRNVNGQKFIWVRTYAKLLREPESQNIIVVAYTRNAENEKRRMTTSRMLLNQLHVATDQLYVNVVALDYNDYSYDVIQENHNLSPINKINGSIQDLVESLYDQYHPDSVEFLDTISSLPNMLGRFVGRNELVFDAKVFFHGMEKWYRHKILPVANEKGKQPYYLVMTQDITGEKQSEDSLKKALIEAKAAGKAKQDFLAHMSHEMRTPLNGIKGTLDIMRQRCELKDDKMLGDAIMSVNHLSGLINDVLDMAKIESGKIELKRNIVSIKELGEYINTLILPMAERKNITYQCKHDWSQFPYIYADMGRIRQILTNLLTNAVKYTDPGGMVSLGFEYRQLEAEQIRLKMVIEDNGIGMSQDYLKSAFVPFERADAAKAISNGTGLGLPITKRLTDLMNGTIEIESQVEKGTRVTVTLDVDLVDESSENFLRYRQCIDDTENDLMSFVGKHVLLVEDNIVNMEIAEYNICSMGMTCEKTYDGEAAWQKYMEMPEGTYDIIFTDIMMPKKDGLTLARDIRSSGKRDSKSIPIVAMTANAFTDDIEKSLESGMNYHLSKPFDMKDMKGILLREFSNNR